MEKSIKINIPEEYEIDKEKSTFEQIIFKKVEDNIFQWDRKLKAVEIKADGEHFLLDASKPTFFCSWNNAMKYFKNSCWKLPSIKQLQIISKYYNTINTIIKNHKGFELEYSHSYWTDEKTTKNCAYLVYFPYGGFSYNITEHNSVRGVSILTT